MRGATPLQQDSERACPELSSLHRPQWHRKAASTPCKSTWGLQVLQATGRQQAQKEGQKDLQGYSMIIDNDGREMLAGPRQNLDQAFDANLTHQIDQLWQKQCSTVQYSKSSKSTDGTLILE